MKNVAKLKPITIQALIFFRIKVKKYGSIQTKNVNYFGVKIMGFSMVKWYSISIVTIYMLLCCDYD